MNATIATIGRRQLTPATVARPRAPIRGLVKKARPVSPIPFPIVIPEGEPSARRANPALAETAFGCPRDGLENRFVYIVISPRARGLSIGVNLNPDQRCNFD